jgi:hypothetical protein
MHTNFLLSGLAFLRQRKTSELPGYQQTRTVRDSARVCLLLFFISFGIDRLFRNLGQRLIGFLLFLQRLIQKL